MSSSLFTADVVEAVCAHMNGDHRDDCLLIVRGLAGRPDAASARMTGIDVDGARFEARLAAGTSVEVQVPFGGEVTERAQLRVEVVRMYRDACTALGIAPRPAEEH